MVAANSVGRMVKRAGALALLALVLAAAGLAAASSTALAAGPIGTVSVDGASQDFNSYDSLKTYLEKQKGKTVVVEMHGDWIRANRATSPLVIPENSRTTLE